MAPPMPDHAAFLRGMNVGRRRISNDDLRRQFEAIGMCGVAVFRASGNVVFSGAGQSPAELTARIEEELAVALGYAVPTFLRTAAQVGAIARHRPFPSSEVEASRGKLQVALLRDEPAPAARAQVLALSCAADRLAFGERELYWLPSGGYLESALDLRAIDALLGQSTHRTKGTVELLAGKHFIGS